MEIFLKTEKESHKLGRITGRYINDENLICALLFQGELGTGKTTIIKFIVKSLKGGKSAEISSPSFNVFNIYPTTPEVIHFDFYRCHEGFVDEEVYEYLYSKNKLVVIEWPEFLPQRLWPEEFVLFKLNFQKEGRILKLDWKGEKGKRLYYKIINSYPF